MLSFQKTPPAVATKGNPIRFSLSSDNYLSSNGTKPTNRLIFTASGQEGNTLTLFWADKSVIITCDPNPDNSGNQIPDNTLYPSLQDWIEACATAMALNYYFSSDFIVSSAAGQIVFSSRKYGSEYLMTWTNTWSDPQPMLSLSGGVPRTQHLFFKVGIIVELFDGSSYLPLAEELLSVNDSGEVTFDIHRIFADNLYPEFKFPEASDNLIINRPNSCRPYRVKAYERYGEDLTCYKMIESSQFHVLNAGVSFIQEAIYNRQESSFWAKLTYRNYFLTWQPLAKTIDRYQTEKLYFLVQETIPSLSLKAFIRYNNGTESLEGGIIIDTVNSPVTKSVYEFILTLDVLQLSNYDQPGYIKNYDIWLEDNEGNQISEIRTYSLDTQTHENVRYFLFLNSLGGYDTLRITGDQEDSLEYAKTSVTKILGDSFTEKDHSISVEKVTEQNRYSANTGWKSREDISWIRDFFLSTQVFLINGRKLIPVKINTTSALQRKDKSELYNISFEYARAYTSKFFTKEIVSAEFDDSYNDDFTNE
jgi:hypothetical protein